MYFIVTEFGDLFTSDHVTEHLKHQHNFGYLTIYRIHGQKIQALTSSSTDSWTTVPKVSDDYLKEPL